MTTTRPAPRKPRKTPVFRNRADALKAKAHAEARRLNLSEPARLNIQYCVTGKRSCADMTLAELEVLVAWLEAQVPARKPLSPEEYDDAAFWAVLA